MTAFLAGRGVLAFLKPLIQAGLVVTLGHLRLRNKQGFAGANTVATEVVNVFEKFHFNVVFAGNGDQAIT